MKAIILKQAISLATLAIAVGGAFMSDAAGKAKEDAALTQGWLKGNPEGTICHQSNMCEINNTGNICRTGPASTDPQLFGKFVSTGPCVREVYKP